MLVSLAVAMINGQAKHNGNSVSQATEEAMRNQRPRGCEKWRAADKVLGGVGDEAITRSEMFFAKKMAPNTNLLCKEKYKIL